MPVVRRGERTQGIGALPTVRMQSAETFESEGGGLAQAKGQAELAKAAFGANVAQVGVDRLGKMWEEERQAADQTALLKANNEIAAWKTAKLYDPKTGVLLRKGEGAQGIPEEVAKEFQELTGRIAKGLHTPKQRAAFANLSSNEFQSIDLQTRRHVFQEMQTFRAGELQATVENSINAGIMAYSDPKLVAIELEKATSAIKANAPALGVGPEAMEKQIRAVQSKTHVGVIANLLADENEQAASAYFDAAKGQIEGDALDQVTKALEEGSVRKQSQVETDKIVAAGGTLAEQRAKAKAIEDPKLRDAVLQRVEHEGALNERAEREAEQSSMRTAYDLIDQHRSVDKIPPMVWATFDGSTRSAMRGYAQALVRGVDVETDLGAYYRLVQMAGDNPDGFTTENLLKYRAVLSESDFQQLASWQLNYKEAGRKGAGAIKELEGFRTNNQILTDTLIQNGVDPNAKYDTPQGKAVAQIRRMLDQKVALVQSPTQDPVTKKVTPGRKITEAEIQAEVDNIMSATTTPEGQQPVSWWSLVRPFTYDWKDKSKRLIDYTIADVPLAARKGIEMDLKARGVPISDVSVLDRFMELELARSRGRR